MAETRAKRVSAKAEADILAWFFAHIGGASRLVENGKVIPGGAAHGLYQAALSILRERLANGWTVEDIRAHLLEAKDLNFKTVSLQDVLAPLPRGFDDRNLMRPEVLYTHGILCVRTPPVVHMDADTGLQVMVELGGLARRERFTLKDLVSQYMHVLEPVRCVRADIETALNYFLHNGRSLDEVLFAIDFWHYNDRDDTRGVNAWKLRDYFDLAAQELAWRLGKENEWLLREESKA